MGEEYKSFQNEISVSNNIRFQNCCPQQERAASEVDVATKITLSECIANELEAHHSIGKSNVLLSCLTMKF